ncbi:ATP adenylyltransferase [Colletotrichum truncatum]|uniref:ATP adenylyltransferase n=1 Tax=Colletotrichum truncatum TaxID=5467 RepID=A0ACC3Z1I4_COLTU|nr:ATP adenylyltransferase [Colletotrichum truncatum]XP_036580809.1 ATP adenylyltransferase [Colletotrichum truncatum]KAF6780618.1 ATP adenylyltransferase [Colletotrichum truncatum]KAF6788881.1 ATP adenylyltransferase [Colletotrichum truncatum]
MGSQEGLDEVSVLARFDELVAQGTVLYSPDLKKVYHTDEGLKFEFRLTSALKSKPTAVWGNSELDEEQSDGAAAPAAKSRHAEVTLSGKSIELDADGRIPGGDISVAGFIVDAVDNTHLLMFNKFCAYRPHLILLTADGHRRQFEALKEDDLDAATRVLGALNRGSSGTKDARGDGDEYLAIFNCGKEGGCSRLHKHMQIIPAPREFALWPDEKVDVPFEYFVHRFSAGWPSPGDLARVYEEMLMRAARLVPGREDVVEEDEDGHKIAVPHNVILGRRWMVVIPRTKAGVDGAEANAAGMLGMVWASGEETLEKWLALGPRWVLGEVGVRKVDG